MAVVGSSAGGWQGLQPQPSPVVVWTAEEQEILQQGLIKYCMDSGFDLYARIAADLQGKSIRDVAMRCKWMTRRARYPSISPYAPPVVPMHDNDVNAIDGHIGSLLDTNKQLFSRIEANLSQSNPMENISLLTAALCNILEIKARYEESLITNNMPMPALPVTLENYLVDFVVGMASAQYPIPPH
ncbi:hypothetical protein J5N97_020991 [Dioscorea zingiberensis]|uniref:Myb-like domain-containing protein n=1 Tax=Dioscorea zingiberensis TaxID=325984 RepID=A0A9D5CI66_9LILI|nr:hypothetical protein J5N97_020991 [Dioscorea zingiberensis]